MKKRTLLWVATLAAILTPLAALTACKDDTSPTILRIFAEISVPCQPEYRYPQYA